VSHAPGGFNGDRNVLLYPTHDGVCYLTGMDVLPPFVAYGPACMSDAERIAALDAWRGRLRGIEGLAPLGPDGGLPAA